MCSPQLYGPYTDAITNLLYLFYNPLARFVGGAYNENVYT